MPIYDRSMTPLTGFPRTLIVLVAMLSVAAHGLILGSAWRIGVNQAPQSPEVRLLRVDMSSATGPSAEGAEGQGAVRHEARSDQSPPSARVRLPSGSGRDPLPAQAAASLGSELKGLEPRLEGAIAEPVEAWFPSEGQAATPQTAESAAALEPPFAATDSETAPGESQGLQADASPPSDGLAESPHPVTEDSSGPPQTDASAAAEPAPRAPTQPHQTTEGRWHYQVFYGDWTNQNAVATLDYVMRLQGDRYELRTEAHASGLLALFYRGAFKQVSTGRIDSSGFHSASYDEQRGERAPQRASVEMTRQTLTFASGETASVHGPSIQDRLSVIAQLAWLMTTHPERLKPGTLEWSVYGVNSVRPMRFSVSPPAVLATPAGTMQSIPVKTQSQDGEGTGSIELWLNASAGLMPARLRITDGSGRVLDHVLANP